MFACHLFCYLSLTQTVFFLSFSLSLSLSRSLLQSLSLSFSLTQKHTETCQNFWRIKKFSALKWFHWKMSFALSFGFRVLTRKSWKQIKQIFGAQNFDAHSVATSSSLIILQIALSYCIPFFASLSVSTSCAKNQSKFELQMCRK